jgi:hypothetical protein
VGKPLGEEQLGIPRNELSHNSRIYFYKGLYLNNEELTN